MTTDYRRIRHFELTQKANSFFYFLSHAFILKKFFHEDLVKEYESKEGIELAINSLHYVKRLTGKIIYLMMIKALLEFRMSFLLNFRQSHDSFGYVFILLTLIGALIRSIIVFDRQDYDSVMLLRINGNDYAHSVIRKYVIEETVLFAIAFIPFSFYFDTPYLTAICYLAGYLSLHLISELIQLNIWVKNDYSTEPAKKETAVRAIISIVLLAVIAFSLIRNFYLSEAVMIPVCLLLAAAGVYSYRQLTTSEEYARIFRYNLSLDKILATHDTITDGRTSIDLNQMSKDIQLKEVSSGKSGYGYIFDIFLSRYHKSLFRGQLLSLIITAVIGIAAIIIPYVFEEFGGDSYFETIYSHLGVLVYCIYYVCQSSRKFVLSCFMQIDRYLIHYHFFRRPQDISSNYLLRLKQIIRMAMVPVLMIISFLLIIYLLNVSHIKVSQLAVIIIFPLVLAMFYSIYNLSAYYLFQPYSFDGIIVNKLYIFVDYVIYILSYISLQVEIRFTFTLIVILTLILAAVSAGLYVLVIKRAPKYFRVR